MKKLVTYITVIASAFVLTTNAAQAKPKPAPKPAPKAKPVPVNTTTYKKVFSHYDRHGKAVYTTKKVIVKKAYTPPVPSKKVKAPVHRR